jgi:serine protease Do
VVAIGNPFGLGGTVTAGIISARGRDINAGPYDDFLQTDASINRGNSGGPMFNLKGEVIGINTAIFSPTGGSVGIGFAIPAAVAKPVIKQLIKNGRVRRGWLGVHIQVVSEEIAESLGLKKAEGALVASVIEDGPAEKSGIEAGDIILAFDNKKVTHMRRLPRIVAETDIEKPVSVLVWRDSKEVTIEVTVGELEEDETKVASRGGDRGKDEGEHKVKDLGLTLSIATKRLRERFNLDDEIKGVVVVSVDDDGPASEKGIRPGDVVVEVGQQEVTTPGEVLDMVKKTRESGRKSVLMLLEGQGGLRFVALRIASG